MKKKFLGCFLILVILAAASGALVYSILHLMTAYQDYEDGRGVYEELEDDFVERPDTQNENEADSDEGKYEYLQIDFDGLRKVNPDVIAWIDIPGAGISYPVLQGEDNSYYLTHLASGQFGISGSIFMDYHNRQDFSDQNTIIYGHNMKDDSMWPAPCLRNFGLLIRSSVINSWKRRRQPQPDALLQMPDTGFSSLKGKKMIPI